MSTKESFDDLMEAKRRYGILVNTHQDVVNEMENLIDDYVESTNKIYSNKAGGTLLPKCPRFGELCKEMAARVFGLFLMEYLDNEIWIRGTEKINGKDVTIYERYEADESERYEAEDS